MKKVIIEDVITRIEQLKQLREYCISNFHLTEYPYDQIADYLDEYLEYLLTKVVEI